jgi:hypothetical protein
MYEYIDSFIIIKHNNDVIELQLFSTDVKHEDGREKVAHIYMPKEIFDIYLTLKEDKMDDIKEEEKVEDRGAEMVS